MFRHADVCVLCASCGSSQCCVLHDLQFVNACLCACTEMLSMCVLYVSFGSKVIPRTFECVVVYL